MSTARRQSAFTLGELGAVLAATSIVVGARLLGLRTYTVKQEVGEGIALANELIPAVTELFLRHGEVPAKLDLARLAHPEHASPFVESVTIVDGRIDVLFGGQADPVDRRPPNLVDALRNRRSHVVWLCGNEHRAPGSAARVRRRQPASRAAPDDDRSALLVGSLPLTART